MPARAVENTEYGTRVPVRRRGGRDPSDDSDPQHVVTGAVQERVVPKAEHALLCGFTVGLERVRRGGLVKRQAELPFAAEAVGKIPVAQLEHRAAAEEQRIDEVEIEMAPIGVAAVDERHLRGRAEKIALDEADVPRVVAPHAREAGLGLRAPAVRSHRAQREFPVRLGANGIHAHRPKHAEGAQGPLAFCHSRRIERSTSVQQQAAADHPLARPPVQLVRQVRDPIGRRVVPVEDVAVFDEDGIDPLGRRSGLVG